MTFLLDLLPVLKSPPFTLIKSSALRLWLCLVSRVIYKCTQYLLVRDGGICLADPDFGTLILGLRPLLKWWVRAGGAEPQLHSIRTLTGCCQVACLLALPQSQVAAHHVSLLKGDDLISHKVQSWPFRGSSFLWYREATWSCFYLPTPPSSTTKVQMVFDASANISTGFSLNKTLLVGTMVHYSLIDVLLQFRLNRILTADVSWMYCAIALVESDKDFHRFVWRTSVHDRVKTFAWPSIKQNYCTWSNFHLLPRKLTMLPKLMMGSVESTQWWAPSPVAGSLFEGRVLAT